MRGAVLAALVLAAGIGNPPRSRGPKNGKTARRALQKVAKKARQKNRSKK